MPTSDLLQRPPSELAGAILATHGSSSDWLDEFAEALDRGRAGQELGRVLDAWGLSQSEAAVLFGVSRQALSKWLHRGVPAERTTAVADLSAATDLLVRYLKRERIPAVVRRPAPALQGRSLVDLVGEARTRDVLIACRAMFDVAGVHA